MSTPYEMQTLSLQDVISEIEKSNCNERATMLDAAELIETYFDRAAHEITLNDIREIGGYFLLYLLFRRVPLAQVDAMVETANRVAAKLHLMQREITKVSGRKNSMMSE